jgi:hypothetical protein
MKKEFENIELPEFFKDFFTECKTFGEAGERVNEMNVKQADKLKKFILSKIENNKVYFEKDAPGDILWYKALYRGGEILDKKIKKIINDSELEKKEREKVDIQLKQGKNSK